jgi:Xaa-Pro aminopeptidase
MRAQGIDCLLIYGNAQGWQNVFYLTNHWDLVSCFLVFPAAGEPVLVTGVYPHVAAVKAISAVSDVRFGGRESVALVARVLAERGLTSKTIGLVEADSYRMPGIPHRDMLALKQVLPKVEFRFSTSMLEDIRRVKSPEEMEILRECGALTDAAYARVVDAIRPGVTERDLAAVIAASPGDTVAVLVGSTPMAKPDAPNPSIRPTLRELKRGDIVMVELSKGGSGYAGQLHGMISLGPPTELYQHLFGLALGAYDDICGVLRDGCTPQQVAAAAQPISDAGYVISNPLTHGFGLGIESGLHVGLPGHPAYWPPGDFVFRSGASLTVEPNPCNAQMTLGATAGAMVILHDDRCEPIQKLVHRNILAV